MKHILFRFKYWHLLAMIPSSAFGARVHSTVTCFSGEGLDPHKLQDLCSAKALKFIA